MLCFHAVNLRRDYYVVFHASTKKNTKLQLSTLPTNVVTLSAMTHPGTMLYSACDSEQGVDHNPIFLDLTPEMKRIIIKACKH